MMRTDLGRAPKPVWARQNQKGQVFGPALLTEDNDKFFSSPKAALRTTLDTHSESPHFALPWHRHLNFEVGLPRRGERRRLGEFNAKSPGRSAASRNQRFWTGGNRENTGGKFSVSSVGSCL